MDQLMSDLEDAMLSYYAAKGEHDKALSKYDGYSWDWAGSDYIHAMEEAKKQFRSTFDAAVNAKVEQILKSKGIAT